MSKFYLIKESSAVPVLTNSKGSTDSKHTKIQSSVEWFCFNCSLLKSGVIS